MLFLQLVDCVAAVVLEGFAQLGVPLCLTRGLGQPYALFGIKTRLREGSHQAMVLVDVPIHPSTSEAQFPALLILAYRRGVGS